MHSNTKSPDFAVKVIRRSVPTIFPIKSCVRGNVVAQKVNYAPWRAFSAQMRAMILLSSALWAACSRMTRSSTPSVLVRSAVLLSMRFCSCSIFWRVLSRNGALKLMASGPEVGSLISSLRGALFCPPNSSPGTLSGCWPLGLADYVSHVDSM